MGKWMGGGRSSVRWVGLKYIVCIYEIFKVSVFFKKENFDWLLFYMLKWV